MLPFKHYWFKAKLLFYNLSKLLTFGVRAILVLSSVIALILIVYELGYDLDKAEHKAVHYIYYVILTIFFIVNTFRFLLQFNDIRREKGRWIEFISYLTLLIVLLVHLQHPDSLPGESLFVRIFRSHAVLYVLLSFLSILELSKGFFGIMNKRVAPGLLFAYSFLFIIIIGTGMLLLPRATASPISFIDALFTATSAVCVTGLTVLDISSTYTLTGQIIIMVLIQVGGIGVMTFTSFFALTFMGHSSFQNNLILKDLLNEDNLNGIFRTLLHIIFTTLSIELIGAALIYYSISGTMGMNAGEEIFFSIFHSISGFCNAGFSTLSGNLYDPMVSTNYLLHTLIAVLIIFGGLGFPILLNFYRLVGHFFHNEWLRLIGEQKRYIHTKIIHINTRIAMYTTLILLAVGFVLFFLLEYNNTLRDLSWSGKLATAFFGGVTPRTAGFNTINLTSMMPATVMLTAVLMWIGASPMSTGGGIKTTTFAIACMNIVNIARGRTKMEIGRREISRMTIQRAFAVIFLSILWLVISVFCIAIAEPDVNLTAVFFECVSALGTVGLTLNLTPDLGVFSKSVLITTMFVGRVGLLTILSGLIKRHSEKRYSYPQESVMVG